MSRPTRFTIVQPGLAKYRVPVFRALAERPNVSLRVLYGTSTTLKNAAPDGFEGVERPQTIRRFFGHPLYWHQAHLEAASTGDVAIMTWDVHFLSLLPAIRRARRRGVGTVLWGHGFGKGENALRRGLRNRLGRLADALLVYNHRARHLLLEDGFDPERVFVAPNTVDLSDAQRAVTQWQQDTGRLAAKRAELGLGEHVLLHVSRWQPQRRVEQLLEATSRLTGEFPDLKLVLIGQEHDNSRTRADIERLRLGGHVVFTGPIYEEKELAPYFLSAAAMVFPAEIGLSLHHAFAYGLPVVTHNDVDLHAPEVEALKADVNGLTFPPNDVEALAAQLRQLLADSALRLRLSAAARATIAQRYTLANMVDGFIASAERAIQRRDGRQR